MDLGLLKKVAAVSLFTAVAGLLGHAWSFSTASAETPAVVREEPRAGGDAWNQGRRGEGIEGVWLSQVTITDCKGTTTRAFQALNMFQAGGTLTDTDSQPPASHGPGFGTWERRGSRVFHSVFQFFRFNADGSLAGSNYVDRTITLDADGDGFTSTVAVSVLAPTGVVVGSACGTETAARVK
jgi:hypothetical protein